MGEREKADEAEGRGDGGTKGLHSLAVCVHGAFESWAIMQRTSCKLYVVLPRDVSYEAMTEVQVADLDLF